MNSNCQSCDVEKECGYQYKPCDCCNYRKFVPKATAQVILLRTEPPGTLFARATPPTEG